MRLSKKIPILDQGFDCDFRNSINEKQYIAANQLGLTLYKIDIYFKKFAFGVFKFNDTSIFD